jgi:hypothetical protein
MIRLHLTTVIRRDSAGKLTIPTDVPSLHKRHSFQVVGVCYSKVIRLRKDFSRRRTEGLYRGHISEYTGLYLYSDRFTRSLSERTCKTHNALAPTGAFGFYWLGSQDWCVCLRNIVHQVRCRVKKLDFRDFYAWVEGRVQVF